MDVLKQYLPLCWLQNNPLDLPRSMAFFRQNLLFSFVIEYLMQANMTDDPIEAFFEVGIKTVLTLMFVLLVLFLNKTLYLYIQITTAILFCANVISVAIVPVMVWLTVSESPLSYYLLGLLVLWYFAVVAYIFKRTVIINTSASIALALFYFVATYLGAFALGQMI
ncbi:conserved membrane hypothetical protein [Crenothrix polyspora]|jgi:hypothetical protein|uniref:Yip1 domain-containing protein n=1 Tax=Crenothrix polyspora TaxID=360316 RepID=A0A1R4HGR1_9GAMM|nr:hypothetical protein [Crenothrix polyspora]SJM95422.1 conserved membrane hypothetical protein [Crenothrix polyspora]